MHSLHSNGVVILDFGSQYTQLIARRVREFNIFSEILPPDSSIQDILEQKPKALILSGGPSSVYETTAPKYDQKIFALEIPILGICYGLQLMVHYYGGEVKSSAHGEYGFAQVEIEQSNNLFYQVPQRMKVWMSHMDTVDRIPEDWMVTSHSSNGVIASLQNKHETRIATQFHPEVIHTEAGNQILSNFLFRMTQCASSWTTGNFIDEQIENIQIQTEDKKVLLGVSGGVDSTVVAALLGRAIGSRTVGILIDHGLMRKNEANECISNLNEILPFQVVCFDESEYFLQKLQGVTDPEEKRKIIGEQFIRSFERIAKEQGQIDFLAQGTLYPDVVESGFAKAGSHGAVIKSHHNVGGLPDKMDFQLIEPLRDLFKDEVRKVGLELGIPYDMVYRHPFPGPGLAVRIIGEVTQLRLDILRDADAVFIDILKEERIYDEIWQAFCVLIPVQTVGVMGDKRTYENLIGLRAVTSHDGMTADWYHFDGDILSKISNAIVNKVSGINRVVYDVTSKPPGTIEWE